jgi:hypothetical protein
MQIVLAQHSVLAPLRLNHTIEKRGKKNEKVLNRRTIEQRTEEQGMLKAKG